MTDRYITVVGSGGPSHLHRVCTRCAALIMPVRDDQPGGAPTPEAIHDEFHDRINRISEAVVGLLETAAVKGSGAR